MYLVIIVTVVSGAWLIMRKRKLTRFVLECRDRNYLNVFEEATLASERGKVAQDMCAENPRIANDREYFVNICFKSGVKPELAAQAWIDRVLRARFR